jgi:metal-sulfur cluster biosynthetic enzyme
MTKNQVTEQLRQVLDPELGMNIVDLGFIRDIQIKNGQLIVKMTLSSPQCPLAPLIIADVKKTLKKLPAVKKILVDLVDR